MQTGTPILEGNLAMPNKTTHALIFDPAILLGIYPEDICPTIYKDTCTRLFISALVVTAKY